MSTRNNAEPELDMICRANGTSTQGAFQAVVAALDLEQVLAAAGMSSGDREALMSWRGSI
jgi:protein-tyrosine phosphatase